MMNFSKLKEKGLFVGNSFPCKIKSGVIKASRVAVFTDRKLFLFSSAGDKIKNSFSWTDLSYLEWTISQSTASLTFGKTRINFINVSGIQQFLRSILDCAQRMLMPSKLKEFSSAFTWTGFLAKPNDVSCTARLREKAEKLNMEVDKKLVDIITFSQPTLTFGDFNPNYLPLLIEILPFTRTIKNIVISKMDNIDSFKTAFEITSEKNRIKRYEIEGPTTEFFDMFITNVRLSTPKLFSLAFTNSSFGEGHLKRIADNFYTQGIEFHNAISNEAMTYFASTFLSNVQPIYLSLDRSTNLNLTSIASHLQNVVFLSLAYCGLEITTIFQSLSTLPNLRMLNVSGNNCFKLASERVTMPPKLLGLFAKEVKWGENCLTALFSFRFTNLCLSKATATDWESFFKAIEKINDNCITNFSWDENPVDKRLFTYLGNHDKIKAISLSGCFNATNSSLLVELNQFLRKSTNLKKLIIRSNEKNVLRNGLASIIDSFVNNPTLDELDATDSHCSKEVIEKLIQNISHFSILSVDGADFDNPTQMNALIDAAHSNCVTFPFPCKSVEKYVTEGFLKPEEAEALLNNCRYLDKKSECKQPPNITELAPSNSPYVVEFHVKKQFERVEFPIIPGKNDIEFFKKAPEINFIFKPKTPVKTTATLLTLTTIKKETNDENIELVLSQSDDDDDEEEIRPQPKKRQINVSMSSGSSYDEPIIPATRAGTDKKRNPKKLLAQNLFDEPNEEPPTRAKPLMKRAPSAKRVNRKPKLIEEEEQQSPQLVTPAPVKQTRRSRSVQKIRRQQPIQPDPEPEEVEAPPPSRKVARSVRKKRAPPQLVQEEPESPPSPPPTKTAKRKSPRKAPPPPIEEEKPPQEAPQIQIKTRKKARQPMNLREEKPKIEPKLEFNESSDEAPQPKKPLKRKPTPNKKQAQPTKTEPKKTKIELSSSEETPLRSRPQMRIANETRRSMSRSNSEKFNESEPSDFEQPANQVVKKNTDKRPIKKTTNTPANNRPLEIEEPVKQTNKPVKRTSSALKVKKSPPPKPDVENSESSDFIEEPVKVVRKQLKRADSATRAKRNSPQTQIKEDNTTNIIEEPKKVTRKPLRRAPSAQAKKAPPPIESESSDVQEPPKKVTRRPASRSSARAAAKKAQQPQVMDFDDESVSDEEPPKKVTRRPASRSSARAAAKKAQQQQVLDFDDESASDEEPPKKVVRKPMNEAQPQPQTNQGRRKQNNITKEPEPENVPKRSSSVNRTRRTPRKN